MNQLETKNHKVDSKGWAVKDGIAYINGNETKVKYKESPEGDIKEYHKGFPKEYIGEQLFTFDAIKRLGLESRLPTFEQIKGLKELSLAGYWGPNYKEFYNVGNRSYIWLVDGYSAEFYQTGGNRNNDGRAFGFSGRLLKNSDMTIGQFDYLLERAKENNITVKAREELKVLLSKG